MREVRLSMEDDVHTMLKDYSKKQGCTMNEVLDEILREYFSKMRERKK